MYRLRMLFCTEGETKKPFLVFILHIAPDIPGVQSLQTYTTPLTLFEPAFLMDAVHRVHLFGTGE